MLFRSGKLGTLTFLSNPKYEHYIYETKASDYNHMDTGHYFADIAAIQADKAFGLAAGDTALAAATNISNRVFYILK